MRNLCNVLKIFTIYKCKVKSEINFSGHTRFKGRFFSEIISLILLTRNFRGCLAFLTRLNNFLLNTFHAFKKHRKNSMKINVISIFILMFIASSIVFGQENLKSEQSQIQDLKPFMSSQGNEIHDKVIFEQLFISVNSFNKEAEKQMNLGFPQRAITLQIHYKIKGQLNNDQDQQLKSIAGGFQQEIDEINKKRVKLSLR